MNSDLIQKAAYLYKAGDKTAAYLLLKEIVQAEPENTDAWFGLYICADTEERKVAYLNKVLEINPEHVKARQALEKINGQKTSKVEVGKASVLSREEPSQEDQPVKKAKLRTGPGNIGQIRGLTRFVSPLAFVLLCLSVVWLWYRMDMLEKQNTFLANELSAINSELTNEISSVNSRLTNKISMLSSEFSYDISVLSSDLSTTYALASNANQYAHSHGYSDQNLKTNVQEIEIPLEKLLLLNGVRYSWSEQAQTELGLSAEAEIGLLAQDVEQVFPELVWEDEQGYKHVDYARLSVILLEAMHTQNSMIDQLEERISALEASK